MTEGIPKQEIAEIIKLVEKGLGTTEAVINRGREHGVKVGHKYLVFGLGEEIIDPATGENLGILELVRGRAEVIHVQEKMSTIRSIEMAKSRKRRTIRESGAMMLMMGSTIEEDLSSDPLPFDGIKCGDNAKPI